MKTKSLMVLALIALFIGMGSSAYATVTVTPIVSSDAAGKDQITAIAPGQRFFVNIQVSNTEDAGVALAGAALTLTYDNTLFQVIQHVSGQATGTLVPDNTPVNSADTTDTILGSDGFTAVSDKTGAGIGVFRVAKVAAGKVMFSGAFIDGATGKGLAAAQNKNIFRIRFRAIANEANRGKTGQFALTQTILDNSTAGWGPSATPANDGVVPMLVGAVPSTDTNFSDPTKAFPTIPSTPGTAVSVTVKGYPGVVRPTATSTAPQYGDVIYFYNHYKCLSNPTAAGCTNVQALAGNGDFSHNGNIDFGDVLMLYFYYKGQPPAANPTLE